MGWQDAPLIEPAAGQAAWMAAPLVEEPAATPPELQMGIPPEQPLSEQFPTEEVMQDIGIGAGEAALQMGTGMASTAAGGLVGLGTLVTGGGLDKASERIQAIQQAGTYQPRTRAGTEISNALAYPMEKATEGWGMIGEEFGGETGKALGEVGFQSLATIAMGKAALKSPMAGRGPSLTLPRDPVALNALLEKTIKTGFEKGIKPTGVLKTRKLMEQESQKQVQAVKSIINSKEALKFKDEFGEITQGKVPDSLDTLSQAVVQKKLAAFEAYNAKQLEVGEAGIKIPLDTSVRALEEFIADPIIQNHTPGAISHASKALERLRAQGEYTPGEAQRAMTILNQSLEAYRKNPTAENASIAGSDAIVANNLRERLNNIVDTEAPSGPGYIELKKEFGAIKSIEASVNNRLRKHNQQAGKSALNFYDVFSANDLIQGVLTGSPVIAAKGLGLGYIARKIKLAKDPNRAVKQMFQKSEKIMAKIKQLTPKEDAAKIVADIEPLLAESQGQLPPGATQQRNRLPPGESPNQLALPRGSLAQPKQLPAGQGFELVGRRLPVSSRQALPPGTQPNQLALPAGQGFQLVSEADAIRPPVAAEAVPGVVNAYERMFQIAQSPEGMRLLVERLGREERYTKLLDELLNVPTAAELPPPPGVIGAGEGFQMMRSPVERTNNLTP